MGRNKTKEGLGRGKRHPFGKDARNFSEAEVPEHIGAFEPAPDFGKLADPGFGESLSHVCGVDRAYRTADEKVGADARFRHSAQHSNLDGSESHSAGEDKRQGFWQIA